MRLIFRILRQAQDAFADLSIDLEKALGEDNRQGDKVRLRT